MAFRYYYEPKDPPGSNDSSQQGTEIPPIQVEDIAEEDALSDDERRLGQMKSIAQDIGWGKFDDQGYIIDDYNRRIPTGADLKSLPMTYDGATLANPGQGSMGYTHFADHVTDEQLANFNRVLSDPLYKNESPIIQLEKAKTRQREVDSLLAKKQARINELRKKGDAEGLTQEEEDELQSTIQDRYALYKSYYGNVINSNGEVLKEITGRPRWFNVDGRDMYYTDAPWDKTGEIKTLTDIINKANAPAGAIKGHHFPVKLKKSYGGRIERPVYRIDI